MKKYSFNIILLALATMAACGPNAEQQAQQQQHRDDSVKSAAVSETKNSLEKKEALTQEFNTVNSALASLKDKLKNATADLDVANDKMKHIKDFHLGRMDKDREKQIKDQNLAIQALEDSIPKIKSAISEAEQKIGSLKSQLESYK